MAWFKRRRENEQANLVTSMAAAFGQALAGVLTSQTEQIKQATSFLTTIQELSAKQTMRLMGQKGGRTTQARKKAAKRAVQTVDCVLCSDPMHRGTTLEQITLHRLHEGRGDDMPLGAQAQEEPEKERGN